MNRDEWLDGPEPERKPNDSWIDLACALAVGLYAMFWLNRVAAHYEKQHLLPVAVALIAVALVRLLQPRDATPAADRASP